MLLDYGHTYKYDTFNRDGTANTDYMAPATPTTVPTPALAHTYCEKCGTKRTPLITTTDNIMSPPPPTIPNKTNALCESQMQ